MTRRAITQLVSAFALWQVGALIASEVSGLSGWRLSLTTMGVVLGLAGFLWFCDVALAALKGEGGR